MKNYRIDIFNEKELRKNYISDLTSVDFFNIESLIFNIYNLKEKDFSIISKIYEQEILLVAQYNNFITPDGFLYDKEIINYLEGKFTEEVDAEGNIYGEDLTVKIYRNLEKEKPDVNGLIYLSNKDIKIYLNTKAEELYKEVSILGLNIVGFSGIVEPSVKTRQIDLVNGIYKFFKFNINIFCKKEFIKKSIKFLESNISIKGYTIKKLKEELLNKIKLLDEKYGTEGKNILIENKKKTSYFKYVLLILYLEGKINIIEYKDYSNGYYVDLKEIKNEDKNSDEFYEKSEILIDKELFNIKIQLFKNGTIHFGDKNFSLIELDSNKRNGIILLLLIIKLGNRKNIDKYYNEFSNYKKELLPGITRNVKIKMKTFISYPSRWNNFAKENDIKIYIMKDKFNLELTTIYPDKKPYNTFF